MKSTYLIKDRSRSLRYFCLLAAACGMLVLPVLDGYTQTTAVPAEPAITLEITSGNYIEVLDVDGADINNVMEAISDESRFNIVVEGQVEGKVEIFLTDIDVRDALRIILEELSLAYSEETVTVEGTQRDIIRVMEGEVFEEKFGYAFGKEIQTRIVPLVYIEAEDVQGVLEQMKSPTGKIILNQETNTFVLMDEPRVLAAMEEIIGKLDVPIETEEFTLKFANAPSVAEEIRPLLSRDIGRLQVDREANSLIVTDSLLKIQEIEKLVRDMDMVGKKVQFDVKVIQITLSDEHDTGVDWEAIVSDYQAIDFAAFDTARVLPKEREVINLGTITAEDLTILTEALETVGEIKTVFVDEMITDNRDDIQFLIPLEAVSSVDKEGKEETYPMMVGDLRIYLTPRIQSEESVNVDVQPASYVLSDDERSQVRKNILIRGVEKGAGFIRSATRALPGIGDGRERFSEDELKEEKEDKVTVEVENGSTIVIGGMIKEVWVKSIRKIPLLGDLPILGFAFQSEGEQLRNSEVIVFLTVKTVNE